MNDASFDKSRAVDESIALQASMALVREARLLLRAQKACA